MIYEIKNNFLKATINSKGAELITLVDNDNINRLHTPSKETWNRVSPILFPQISKTRDFLYRVNGQDYHMTMHGFCRDKEINPIVVEKDKIVFLVTDDEETLKMYPYKFELYITYELIENNLNVSFEVVNKDNKPMLYMLGGHPGFKVPLFDNEKYEDYYIKFQQKENVDAMQVIDGYLASVLKPYLINEDIINIRHDIFNPDAIVLKNLKSTYVDIVSKNHNKKIRFHCSDFEIFAIWSTMSEKADFVCLEPWNGIQKDFVLDHEKMGVLKLEVNEKRNFSYKIEVI